MHLAQKYSGFAAQGAGVSLRAVPAGRGIIFTQFSKMLDVLETFVRNLVWLQDLLRAWRKPESRVGSQTCSPNQLTGFRHMETCMWTA